MAMRETVRSLRAYFILSGLASLYWSVSALRLNLLGSVSALAILNAISIVFSLAFLYVGFALAGLLKSHANRIVALLYASGALTVLLFLLSLLGGFVPFALISCILTLLILWYLLKNIRRLTAEAHASPPAPVPGTTSAP
jgi:hypothetical protein